VGVATAALAAAFHAHPTTGEAGAAADVAQARKSAAADMGHSAGAAGWQLQSFNGGSLANAVLQHLPGTSLTQLTCQFLYSHPTHLAAVCSLTRLQKLTITRIRGYINGRTADVLAPLSALQQLTHLQLDLVGRGQLQHLLLPQLQELHVQSGPVQLQPLQLGHLTGLSMLGMTDYSACMQWRQLPTKSAQAAARCAWGPALQPTAAAAVKAAAVAACIFLGSARSVRRCSEAAQKLKQLAGTGAMVLVGETCTAGASQQCV
jgi:hypothetical protein